MYVYIYIYMYTMQLTFIYRTGRVGPSLHSHVPSSEAEAAGRMMRE